MKNKYLRLYSSNVAVKGKSQSCIYSLGRGELHMITNSLFDILTEAETKTFQTIKNKYRSQLKVFDSYVDYLQRENLAFFTDTPENFPKLKIQFHTPEIVSGVIAEYSFNYDFDKLIKDLDYCNCKSMQLIVKSPLGSFDQLSWLMENAVGSTLRKIDIILSYNSSFTDLQFNELITKYKKIGMITICGGKEQKIRNYDSVALFNFPVLLDHFLTKWKLQNVFIINIQYFMESQFHNPYYNKKVFISEKGDIKNSQFSKEIFGNIGSCHLADVVHTDAFQKLWHTIPPQLETSEFRYCLYNPVGPIEIDKFRNCKLLQDDSHNKYVQIDQ